MEFKYVFKAKWRIFDEKMKMPGLQKNMANFKVTDSTSISRTLSAGGCLQILNSSIGLSKWPPSTHAQCIHYKQYASSQYASATFGHFPVW
jgi:hypothetical protein